MVDIVISEQRVDGSGVDSASTKRLVAVATSSLGDIQVLDALTGEALGTPFWAGPIGEKLQAAAIFRNGSLNIAAAGSELQLWNTSGRPLSDPYRPPSCASSAVSMGATSDGLAVVWARGDWTVRVWLAEKGTAGLLLGHTASPTDVAVFGDLVASAGDHTVRLWTIDGLPALAPLALDGPALEVALGRLDGLDVVVANVGGEIRVWSIDGHHLLTFRADPRDVVDLTTLDLGPAGVIATVGSEGPVFLWDHDGRAVAQLPAPPREVCHVGLSGDTVVTATRHGIVRRWSMDGALVSTTVLDIDTSSGRGQGERGVRSATAGGQGRAGSGLATGVPAFRLPTERDEDILVRTAASNSRYRNQLLAFLASPESLVAIDSDDLLRRLTGGHGR